MNSWLKKIRYFFALSLKGPRNNDTPVAMSKSNAQVFHCYSPVKGAKSLWSLRQGKHKASLGDLMLESRCSRTSGSRSKGHKNQSEDVTGQIWNLGQPEHRKEQLWKTIRCILRIESAPGFFLGYRKFKECHSNPRIRQMLYIV